MKGKIKFITLVIVLGVATFIYNEVQQPEDLDARESEVAADCFGLGSIACPFNNSEVSHVSFFIVCLISVFLLLSCTSKLQGIESIRFL